MIDKKQRNNEDIINASLPKKMTKLKSNTKTGTNIPNNSVNHMNHHHGQQYHQHNLKENEQS